MRYFGFRQSPFGVTPDPGFLFFSKMHRAALDAMIHSIESNLGFTVLLGDPGTGKTTLLFQLLTQYRDCARTAFIFQTQCKSHDLLRHIASEFELPGLKHDEVWLHQRLKNLLVKEARAGRKVLIVIDEAQNLQPSSLETIRLLSDFETAPGKLLHVVLAGSSRLGETLLTPELSQLAQRVFTVCRLEPLELQDVRAYVNFRLGAVASGVVEGLFSPESLAEIAERSGGIPRLINSICYRALSIAYARGERHVSRALVRQAARDLDLSQFRDTHSQAISQPTIAKQELPETNSVGENAALEPCGNIRETVGTESRVNVESQPMATTAVTNSFEQAAYSRPRSDADSAANHDKYGPASGGSIHHGPAKRVRILRPVGLKPGRFNDSSSLVLSAIILVGLGLWTGWHELLRIKVANSGTYTAATQPNAASPADKQADHGHAVALPAEVPITTGEANNRPTGSRTVGGTLPRATTPVVETLPDTLLPSRITRPSSSPGDTTVPNNVATLPRDHDPLISPLATVPPSVPQLNRPVATNPPRAVAPASSLHPMKVVQPDYPKIAKLRHIEGDVVLELQIDSNGNVRTVRTVSGNVLLRKAAEDAARQWQYPPSPEDAFSTPAVTRVRINFRLDPEAGK